jgi:tetratricopeptide (TPR) repeat protein
MFMTLFALLLAAPSLQGPTSVPPRRRITLGEHVSGALPEPDAAAGGVQPLERFELVVEEAGTLTICLESFDLDALLRVETPEGALVAEDDDSGLETDARITFAAEANAPLIVSALAKEGGGEFRLSVHEGELPLPTGAASIDAAIAWRVTGAERALARGDKRAAAAHRVEEGHRRRSRTQLGEARAAYESALALALELGDRSLESKAEGGLGNVCLALGEHPRAREHYERRLALAQELGDRGGEAAALGNLGLVFHALGEPRRALALLERRLALAREAGDRKAEAIALGNLGMVHRTLGDYPRAREAAEGRLALARELGDRLGQAKALAGLGNVA